MASRLYRMVRLRLGHSSASLHWTIDTSPPPPPPPPCKKSDNEGYIYSYVSVKLCHVTEFSVHYMNASSIHKNSFGQFLSARFLTWELLNCNLTFAGNFITNQSRDSTKLFQNWLRKNCSKFSGVEGYSTWHKKSENTPARFLNSTLSFKMNVCLALITEYCQRKRQIFLVYCQFERKKGAKFSPQVHVPHITN